MVPPVAVHVTLVFVDPVTLALNCNESPSWMPAPVGVTETATGAVAVPDSDTEAFETLLVIATEPVNVPAELGANFTVRLAELPAGMLIGNDAPTRLKPVPVAVAPVTDSADPPVFESVMFRVEFVPVSKLPKFNEDGETESVPGAGFTVTVADADFVGSATLVAMTWNVPVVLGV